MRASVSSWFSQRVAAEPLFDSSRPVARLNTVYTGHELDFSGQKDDGSTMLTISAGKGPNAGPMQLVLFALASCALTDVVTILKKQRLDFANLQCKVAGQRSTEGARPYEKIHLAFMVEETEKLNEETFARNVELSFKFCGVHATLSGGPATITHSTSVIKKKQ